MTDPPDLPRREPTPSIAALPLSFMSAGSGTNAISLVASKTVYLAVRARQFCSVPKRRSAAAPPDCPTALRTGYSASRLAAGMAQRTPGWSKQQERRQERRQCPAKTRMALPAKNTALSVASTPQDRAHLVHV